MPGYPELCQPGGRSHGWTAGPDRSARCQAQQRPTRGVRGCGRTSFPSLWGALTQPSLFYLVGGVGLLNFLLGSTHSSILPTIMRPLGRSFTIHAVNFYVLTTELALTRFIHILSKT